MKDLSIIIVNFNTAVLTSNCVRKLLSVPISLDFDIHIVDNASTDNSVSIFEREFPEVRLIKLKENSGFGAANNIAIRQTNSTAVLLLNSDTLAEPAAIQQAYAKLFEKEDLAVLGCRLIGLDNAEQYSYATHYRIGKKFKRISRRDNTGITECAWLCGAFFMVKRKAIDQVGLFDEEFFLYWEDNDWCRRFVNNGWIVAYYPAVSITHIGQGSRNSKDYHLMRYYEVVSECIYFKKYSSPLRVKFHACDRMASHYWAAFTYRVRYLFSHREELKEKDWIHRVQAQGFKDFLEGNPYKLPYHLKR
jgi:GT2 family glycosyltransferase